MAEEVIGAVVDAVVASGGEKVVAGGSAGVVGFKSQYRWRGPVSLLQTVANMRVFGVGHLVLGLLLPGHVVLRRSTVKPPTMFTFSSYSKHSQKCFYF